MTEDEAIEKLKTYPPVMILLVGVISKGNGNFGFDAVGCVDMVSYHKEKERFVDFRVFHLKQEKNKV